MGELDGRTLVLGVSGGIAAYKSAELCSKLVQAGARVRVVLTEHAQQFVGAVTFQALSGEPVYTQTFAAPETYGMGHLSLAASADALVVAPATANLLGKAAAGIADDLLSTTVLSVTCPVLWAPAMNGAMWAQPQVQRNVAYLREIGHRFVGPESGWLACREEGLGRMAEPATILAALRHLLWPKRSLAGRKVLVTAGPTREWLDPVRFLSNPSTGKQGFALAEAAAMRGAEVTLVAGPCVLPTPYGVERVDVVTAAEMLEATLARAEAADMVIGAAAVADHRPAQRAAEKLPKAEAGAQLALEPTADIIAAVAARRRPGQVIVGFAAETHAAVAKAAAKLERKGLDLIVVNDVTAERAGFGGDENTVVILGPAGELARVGPADKLAIAHEVLRQAETQLGQ